MENMTGWDFVLLAVAALVAVSVLVRLMAAHRDRLIAQRREEMKNDSTTDDAS